MTETSMQDDIAAIRAMVSGEGAKQVSKKEKILERVRAILALADDEQLRNPQAADNYRAQADQLMTAYAIEQWQVELKPEGSTRPEPEVRYMNFDWWYQSQFSGDLWSMFHDVARHCRCVIAIRGHGKNGHSYHEIPVIGLPSDIDYFDMLFTHLMLQMARQLEPKPEPQLSFAENAYRLRMSGMERRRVCELLWNSEVPIPGVDTSQPFQREWGSPNLGKAMRAIRKHAEEFAKANGLETTKVSTVVWQRSFSRGFVDEIGTRLWRLRRDQENLSGGSTGSMAVALRDIYDVAKHMYDELFPPPAPVKTTTVTTKRRTSRAVVRSKKMSGRALEAGREAGRKADLANKPSDRVSGGRGSLPKGS